MKRKENVDKNCTWEKVILNSNKDNVTFPVKSSNKDSILIL